MALSWTIITHNNDCDNNNVFFLYFHLSFVKQEVDMMNKIRNLNF